GSRRATSATSWPCSANTCASAAPMPDEAPVTNVTGWKIDIEPALRADPSSLALPRCWRGGSLAACRMRALGRHAPADLDALARRDAQEIGSAPNHVLLEFAHPSVSIDDFPHHLDNAPPPRIVDRAVDQAGEMIEIDGVAIRSRRLLDELRGRFFV